MTKSDVRRLRKALGLTQDELARRIGVTHATVNRWENGVHSPRGMALKALERMQRKVQKANT